MLTRNLGTKLFALLLAVVLWAYAVARTRPTAEVTVWAPVYTKDLASEYSYTAVPDRAAVRVRGPRDRISALEREHGALVVFASAKDLQPGEHTTALMTPKPPAGIRVISVEPNLVRLRVERLVERTLRLVLKVEQMPPSGYTLSGLQITPPEVQVRGTDSEVARIAAAGVVPDLEMLAGRGMVAAEIGFYDGRGQKISPALAAVEPPIATISARTMQMSTKVVPVYVNVDYPAESGWRVVSVEVRPSTVVLVGPPKALASVAVLRLSMPVTEPEPLVIDTLPLSAPTGLDLRGAKTAKVSVRMAK